MRHYNFTAPRQCLQIVEPGCIFSLQNGHGRRFPLEQIAMIIPRGPKRNPMKNAPHPSPLRPPIAAAINPQISQQISKTISTYFSMSSPPKTLCNYFIVCRGSTSIDIMNFSSISSRFLSALISLANSSAWMPLRKHSQRGSSHSSINESSSLRCRSADPLSRSYRLWGLDG